MKNPFQKIIVFVCEYRNDSSTWSAITSLIEKDEECSKKFLCTFFDYTDIQLITIENAKKNLNSVVTQFEKFIEELRIENKNSEFILVGHGTGGIIIQKYLQEKIIRKSLDEISYLRQLIFFSVPSYIEKQSSFLNKMFHFSFRKNPIIKLTQSLEEEIKDLRKLLKERIILAEEFSSHSKPIPTICFGSKDDKIVQEKSAKGEFNNYHSLTGDHQSIILPKNKQDIRYTEFKQTLLNPPVHQSIFEIEYLKANIKIEPIELKEYQVKHGSIERIVKTNNSGRIDRIIKFSDRNICKDLFTLRYGIENEYGFISANISGAQNETSETNIRKYNKRGLEYFFGFYPHKKLSDEYSLNVNLLDGFREKNRDVHFHLGKGRNRYQKLSFELDLSLYMEKGHSISARLYFYPEDSHSCEHRFEERISSHLLPQTQNDGGICIWELEDVVGGVIDICWEIC